MGGKRKKKQAPSASRKTKPSNQTQPMNQQQQKKNTQPTKPISFISPRESVPQ